jgi:hypothetical protein
MFIATDSAATQAIWLGVGIFAFGASATCALVRHFRFSTLSDPMKRKLIRGLYLEIAVGTISMARFFIHASAA